MKKLTLILAILGLGASSAYAEKVAIITPFLAQPGTQESRRAASRRDRRHTALHEMSGAGE